MSKTVSFNDFEKYIYKQKALEIYEDIFLTYCIDINRNIIENKI